MRRFWLAFGAAFMALVMIAQPAFAATKNVTQTCIWLGVITKNTTVTYSYDSTRAKPTFVKYVNNPTGSTIVVKKWTVDLFDKYGTKHATASWTENLRESQHNWTAPYVPRSADPYVRFTLADGLGDTCTTRNRFNP